MTSINNAMMQQYMQTYDIDGDKKLDKAEMAKASLNLMGKEDATSQTAGQLFATMVIGGKDGKGLFPDFNKDGAVDYAEMTQLSKSSGQTDAFESSDFKASFKDNFLEGGRTIGEKEMGDLKKIGEQNLTKFDAQNPQFQHVLQWLQNFFKGN